MTLYVIFQSNIEFEEYLTGSRDKILKTMAQAAKSNEKFTTLNMSQNQGNDNCSLMAKYKHDNVKIMYALRKEDNEEKFKKLLENSDMQDLIMNKIDRKIMFYLSEEDRCPDDINYGCDLFEEFLAENFKEDTSINSLIANANSILSSKGKVLKDIMYNVNLGVYDEKYIDAKQAKESFDKVKDLSMKLKTPIVTAVQGQSADSGDSEEAVGEIPDMPAMEISPENNELTDPMYKDSLENGVELTEEDIEEEEEVDIGAPSFKVATDESKQLLVNEEGQFSAIEPAKEVTVDMKSAKAEEQEDGSLNIMLSGAVADAASDEQAEEIEGIGGPIEEYIKKGIESEKDDEEVDPPSLIPQEFCEDPTDDYEEHDSKEELEESIRNPAKAQMGQLPSWIHDMIN